MLAPLARPVPVARRANLVLTAAAAAAVAGGAMLVPGLHGEYYLHLAHRHPDVLNTAHAPAGPCLLRAGARRRWSPSAVGGRTGVDMGA